MFKGKKKIYLNVAFYTLLFYFILQTEAYAVNFPSVKRLSGIDRFETAIDISKCGWNTSEYAIIASANDFPDALCAAPLAKKLNAPILLTDKYKLYEGTLNELSRLKVKKVIVVGGIGVISENIEKFLNGVNIQTERIGGIDRYETSIKIAQKLDRFKDVFIVSGENFPDAITVAPIASKDECPIILFPKDDVPLDTKKYVAGLKEIGNYYVIGGPLIVSDNAVKDFGSIKRIYGEDRYETNLKVLKQFFNQYNMKNIFIATGMDFPDALSSSSLAASKGSAVVLTEKTMPISICDYLSQSLNNIEEFTIIGGYGATPDSIISRLYNNNGLYSINNPKKYIIERILNLKNNSKDLIRDIEFKVTLGTLNGSVYQKNEDIQVTGSAIKLISDASNQLISISNIPSLKGGQNSEFKIVRNLVTGAIKYNTDLAKTSGDYRGFEGYKEYTSPAPKIESDNYFIVEAAKKIVGDETNPYLKAKKIYGFVNATLTYDFSEMNKGAYNALSTKKGVCEDFADLFVALCRAVQVPTRVVYGYYIPIGSLTSTPFDAYHYRHAWAEFYLPEYGWIIAEPTVQKFDAEGNVVPSYEYFAATAKGDHFLEGYTNSPYICTYVRDEYTDGLIKNIISVIDDPFIYEIPSINGNN